jgi:phosphoribosylglycinamide formyltransferase 1
MLNIAVLISGGGTNLQALIDAEKQGSLSSGRITLVISSRKDAYGLVRSRENGIATVVIEKNQFDSNEQFDNKILETLRSHNIQIVVLAGFLSILGLPIIKEYDHRIVNIHPSLIPSFCGKGLYGLRVHEAALNKGVKITGATVHYVNEIADDGEIILQKAVDVLENDTPELLQKRVMEQAEWLLLPKGVEMVCRRWAEKGLLAE